MKKTANSANFLLHLGAEGVEALTTPVGPWVAMQQKLGVGAFRKGRKALQVVNGPSVKTAGLRLGGLAETLRQRG